MSSITWMITGGTTIFCLTLGTPIVPIYERWACSGAKSVGCRLIEEAEFWERMGFSRLCVKLLGYQGSHMISYLMSFYVL